MSLISIPISIKHLNLYRTNFNAAERSALKSFLRTQDEDCFLNNERTDLAPNPGDEFSNIDEDEVED